jgi:hypothetical protein
LVSGEDSWYEVRIQNTGSEDEILELAAVEVTAVAFVGPNGSGGFSQGSISDKMSPQRCVRTSGFAVLKRDGAVTTLVKVLTPKDMEGPMSLRLNITLPRIMNLTDCKSQPLEASHTFPVRVRSPQDKK